MKVKAVSGIMLALLLTAMLTSAFNIQPVETESETRTVDVHSQTTAVGQGVERLWSDLPKTMNVLQGESEAPPKYEIDLTILQTLKSQPFKLADNLPSTEVDGTTSLSELQPLAPPILRNFEGLDDLNQPDGFLHRPPDPILAVGLSHVGVMVNSEFAFYTKDGFLVVETSFSDWWSNVYSGASTPFDPRIAYDHHVDRWLMVALVKDDPDSWYLLSVSQTSDPTGAWWNYRLNGTLRYGGEDTWADYPDLGFDGITGGAIYITSNQFTFADSFSTAMLNILPKSALYSGSGFTYWRAWGRTNEDGSQAFTLRAVHTFGNPSGEFLINSKSGGWDKVTLWRVNPTFPPDPVDWVRQATITIGSYSPPPDAQQMGGSATLDTIDNRIYNCMYRNGYLYAAFTEAYDWGSGTVAAIRYLKIDTSTNSADLNVRYGADGHYYWFPAIYTDSSDNIVIVFARSSPTEYAGIRYTGRKTTDTATQRSALLKAGETYITGYRWGDYFGIGNDPSDGSKVWIYGEWAKDCPGVSSDWDWGTWIGEMTFARASAFSEDFEGIFPGDNWLVGDENSNNGEDYWDDNSYRSHGGSWSGWSAGIGSQTSTSTIFYEDFEGAFPGSWNVGDSNSNSGEDYWDDTSYRSYGGSWSGWCADIGDQVTTTVIFYEDFEGAFPDSWIVTDTNSVNGYDYWDDTSYRSYGGSWSGWCADIGDNSVYGVPNNQCHKYDNDMWSSMYRSVSLSGYSSATLSYHYWLDSESNYDYLYVIYWDGSWNYIDSHTGNSGGWQYSSISIPTSATYVGFYFQSDSSIVYEGAYVDNVQLTATSSVPNTSIHRYDNDMYAYMYRSVGLSGYSSATLSYHYWLDSESNYDYLYVIYWDGSWNYIDSHTGNSGGWQYSSVNIPTSATYVGLHFVSDSSVCSYEGAYVDNVQLTATGDIPNSNLRTYDNYMDAYMVRKYVIDASSWSSATLTYYAWYQTESGFDYLQVIVTGDGGASWYYIGEQLSGTSDWAYHSVDIPSTYFTSLFGIGFMYHSDSSISNYEGAYLDDINLEASILNHSPILSNGHVNPTSGDSTTQFTFEVTYSDQDGDNPGDRRHLYVYDNGWSRYDMDYISGNPSDGALFRKVLSGFLEGSHNFFFHFNDEHGAEAYYPADGYLTFTVVPTTRRWTFMVYLDGDNNLEQYGIEIFLRMASVGSTSTVNILVQMDRVAGYDTRYDDWTDTKRFFVTQGMTPTSANAIEDLEELNMGDPNTLSNMIDWAAQNYPANNYCLVLYDHGSGCVQMLESNQTAVPLGVCFDDTNGDFLTLPELSQALSASVRMNVVFFDACCMGMTEVAYQIRNYAEIMVGSEEVGWTPGPYDDYLSDLTANPDMTPSDFASLIVDRYIAAMSGLKSTMSATDLSKIQDLKTATDSFCQRLKTIEDSYHQQITEARSDTEGYEGPYLNYYGYYIDLYNFAELIFQKVPDTDTRNLANQVMNALSSAIIREGHSSQHPNSHGLSIFFPDTLGKYNTFSTSYSNLAFTTDTQWDEFIRYHLEYTPPTYTLTITTTAGGTTSPAPGTYTYSAGTIVDVTAIPNANYVLDHWELDGANVGTINPISVTMDKDHALHAVFLYVPIHDVAITSVAPSTTKAYVGQIVNISVIARNEGTEIETFNVTAYYNTTAIQTQTVTNLAPGTDTTLAFNWSTTGVELGTYIIEAVASTVLGETDTADNTRTCWVVVTILGDIDGDGDVDASDLLDLSKAYGSTPSKPDWNPNCDFNDDDKVDASDLLDLSKNYGKTDPYAESEPINAHHALAFIFALSAAVMIAPKFRNRKDRKSIIPHFWWTDGSVLNN